MIKLCQKAIHINKIFVLLIFFITYSCSKNSELEKILVYSKENPYAWTFVDDTHYKLDTLNVPNVSVFRCKNIIDNFFISEGVKVFPVYIGKSRSDENIWTYDDKNNVLMMYGRSFKVISFTKNSIIVECNKEIQILLKFPIKMDD